MSYVWILNPDAETEIRAGGDYTAPRAQQKQMEARRAQFEPLVRGERSSFVHELAEGTGAGMGHAALFWCPTRSARRAAARAGFAPGKTPSDDTLKQVLSREFLVRSDLPAPPGRTFVRTPEELSGALAQLGPGVALRTKREFGFAGRGQRSLREKLIKDDARFLSEGLGLGGLLIEPELVVLREFSLHGLVLPGYVPILGEPCALFVDEHGQPTAIQLAETSADRKADLTTLGERTAAWLEAAGYFGAFGIDVLEAEAPDQPGQTALYVSDLNARFTLGWSTGMASKREQALTRLLA